MFIKNCVFSQFTATHPLYVCLRATHFHKRSECTVTLIGWPFSTHQKQPSAGEGGVANYRRILGKNTIFNEHTVEKIYSGSTTNSARKSLKSTETKLPIRPLQGHQAFKSLSVTSLTPLLRTTICTGPPSTCSATLVIFPLLQSQGQNHSIQVSLFEV